jgi:SAM-dependent methyltransferase
VKINLGCGKHILDGWLNVDRVAGPGVGVVCDLGQPGRGLPFADGSFNELLLSHVLEHISDPLALMQELHRIARDGATLIVRVPYGSSDDAWEDPTHVRPYFLSSFSYFGQPWYWRADYGYRGDWMVEELVLIVDARFRGQHVDSIMQSVKTERNVVKEMVGILSAVKPIRKQLADLQTAQAIKIAFE